MLCLYWSALDNKLHVNYLFKNTAQTKLVLVIGWERFSSLLFSSVYLHFTRKGRRIDIEAFRLTKCNVKMIFVNNFPCFTTPWTIVSLETWLFVLLNVARTEGLHPVPSLEGKEYVVLRFLKPLHLYCKRSLFIQGQLEIMGKFSSFNLLISHLVSVLIEGQRKSCWEAKGSQVGIGKWIWY